MRTNETEIRAILKEEGLAADQIDRIADEIRQGDELLERVLPAAIPSGVRGRVEESIRANLAARKTGSVSRRWSRGLLAAAACLLLLIGITAFWRIHPDGVRTTEPVAASTPYANEQAMTDLIFLAEDFQLEDSQGLVFVDMLEEWIDETNNTNNPLGKEPNHENLYGMYRGVHAGMV